MWRSRPDSVTDGHVVFWLHQPEAIPAEVKLGDVHVRGDQLQVKVRQHKEHESRERWCRRREGGKGASVQSQAGKQGLPPGLTPALTLGNLGKEGERAEHKGHTLPSPG